MIDLQSSTDDRAVSLSRVGITHLALPVKILQRDDGYQHVAAETDLFVDVPATVRGTHLSRFVELLTEWANEPVSSGDIQHLLESARERMDSRSAEVSLRFRYFLERTAPVSGRVGILDFGCEFTGRLDQQGFDFVLGVDVPITTLCPCSKEISRYGAHNQRAMVRLRVRYEAGSFIWLEDLIELAEAQASCPVYPVLKRVDEQHVTEAAYGNPKFVEDVVRDVVLAAGRLAGIEWVSVECESQESIHNHNALASTEARLPLDPESATFAPSIVRELRGSESII